MNITFPSFSGARCLMMPYIQGDPDSVPAEYDAYNDIIEATCIDRGRVGYLTIDESPATAGIPHRGKRAKFGRALHTEAGIRPWSGHYSWGGGGWGRDDNVILDADTQILLANNMNDTCALWDATHYDTSLDGDIGDQADLYPLEEAILMKAGEVRQIGILTPHESLPTQDDFDRQFLRIVGEGVHGREPYFTINPLGAFA